MSYQGVSSSIHWLCLSDIAQSTKNFPSVNRELFHSKIVREGFILKEPIPNSKSKSVLGKSNASPFCFSVLGSKVKVNSSKNFE